MNKKILIISSGQPSANPRLIKESLALSSEGYQVKVIYCPLSPWADQFDNNLFQNNPQIEWIKVGYHPLKEKWKYLYSRIRQKYYQALYNFFVEKNDYAIRSMVLFSQELIKEAKNQKADLFIGHNLGALPAVIKAAEHFNAKAGFDFEDFHRGEEEKDSPHWNKVKQIEEKFVPKLDYVTAASPLIVKEYQSVFKNHSFTTINNCFPFTYAVKEKTCLPSLPIKVFWFSQTVGKNRGLETAIKAIGKIETSQVQLSLLGNCSAEMKNYFLSIAKENGLNPDQLNFILPVDEKKIVTLASMHHIGLACEVPHIINRELCLTNKIFIYLLAANAILFSNTKAQALFLKENSGIGFLYEENNDLQLADAIKEYLLNPALMDQHRDKSLQLAKEKINWETEQQGLLQKVKEVLIL